MPYRHPIGDPIERPTDATEVVRASIDIAAPPADVFRALADPRELAAWLGGEPVAAPTDAPQGPGTRASDAPASRWTARVVAPDGSTGTVSGEYGQMLPPHRLETTWRASWNDFAVERVRFELAPIDVGGVGGTRVTVTHTRARTLMHAPSIAFAGSIAFGDVWPSLLARLAVHVGTTGALARWGQDSDARDSFDALHRAVIALHGTR
jgi:uncharacterized protein YndB with AHSA1/START domain